MSTSRTLSSTVRDDAMPLDIREEAVVVIVARLLNRLTLYYPTSGSVPLPAVDAFGIRGARPDVAIRKCVMLFFFLFHARYEGMRRRGREILTSRQWLAETS